MCRRAARHRPPRDQMGDMRLDRGGTRSPLRRLEDLTAARFARHASLGVVGGGVARQMLMNPHVIRSRLLVAVVWASCTSKIPTAPGGPDAADGKHAQSE